MTEPQDIASRPSFGGILFPLDMFRPTMLASIVGEAFVAKARNVLDAKLELTRHAHSQLVCMRLHGSIVEDPSDFWRENADLALILSQVMPRQVFLFYGSEAPKRQGFLVAQQGQALAGDDADDAVLPADTPDSEWPVARLAGQLRCTLDELANGFEGGPRIELSVMESTGDDRELLMTLAEGLGGPEDADADDAEEADQAAPNSDPHSAAASAAPAPPRRKSPGELQAEAEADRKRRAAEKEAEEAERQRLISKAHDGLRYVVDDIGLVVAVEAELSDTDVLSPFVVRKLDGDLPEGLPRDLTGPLQGKRLDIAVKVDFLSEVLRDGSPLDKARFEAESEVVELDGLEFRRIAVLAPRLGSGTLYRRARAGVYVSREPGAAVPEALVVAVAGIDGNA